MIQGERGVIEFLTLYELGQVSGPYGINTRQNTNNWNFVVRRDMGKLKIPEPTSSFDFKDITRHGLTCTLHKVPLKE